MKEVDRSIEYMNTEAAWTNPAMATPRHRKPVIGIQIRVAFILFVLVSLAHAQSQPAFEAGAARRNISPSTLLSLTGGMGPSSPAKGRQGELVARAIVFRSGNESLAVVGLDLLGFPGVLGDRVRALVRGSRRYEYVSRTSLGEMTAEVLIQNALEMVQDMEDGKQSTRLRQP